MQQLQNPFDWQHWNLWQHLHFFNIFWQHVKFKQNKHLQKLFILSRKTRQQFWQLHIGLAQHFLLDFISIEFFLFGCCCCFLEQHRFLLQQVRHLNGFIGQQQPLDEFVLSMEGSLIFFSFDFPLQHGKHLQHRQQNIYPKNLHTANKNLRNFPCFGITWAGTSPFGILEKQIKNDDDDDDDEYTKNTDTCMIYVQIKRVNTCKSKKEKKKTTCL